MNIKFLDKLSILKEKEDFEIVQAVVHKNSLAQGTYLWILFFAILIASLGLNVNSTAVIIGAMLISPLIGPIVGLGFAVGINDNKLLKTALTSFIFSTIVGLISSTLYFLVSPINVAPSEIISRTSPSIYDVLIALAGGFAGALALSSKQKGNVIPGVAIATALMPPLCSAGYGLATWQLHFSVGALYLYLINTVFIFSATLVATRMLNYPLKKSNNPHSVVNRKWVIGAIVIITIIPVLYLTVDFFKTQNYIQSANRFIENEDKLNSSYIISKVIDPKKKSIELTYAYNEISEQEIEKINSNAKKYYPELGGPDIFVKNEFDFVPNTKNEFKYMEMKGVLHQFGAEIRSLRATIDSLNEQKEFDLKVYTQLKVFSPDILEAIIQPVSIYRENKNLSQGAYLVSIYVKKMLPKSEKNRIELFLKNYLKDSYIKLNVNVL